jgi:hypothetical protein
MKFRALLLGIMAVVSMTSGCCYGPSNPCWGWRLHPCNHCGGCGGCCPAYSSPVSAPVVYRAPGTLVASGPDCPTCNGGQVIHPSTGFPAPSVGPAMPYTPVIGNPMPLPGTPGVVPHDMVPSPMPPKY